MSRYGGEHQALRKAMEQYVPGSPCTRCGRPIRPGQAWDLDHHDDGPGWRGASHAACNRKAGSRLGHTRKQQLARARKARHMITKIALGVEIADDRLHTSIASAGWLDGGTDYALLDLLDYHDGPDAADAIMRIRDERTVTAVVLDPHSPSATLLRPLTLAGVAVTELTTVDVATAHGTFLDMQRAGRLRNTGTAQLDAAVRYANQRPLGGASAWQRRGMPVDMSPLGAATWALHGLVSVPEPRFFAAVH